MNLKYELRNGWKVINEMNNMDAVMKYSDEYMDFLNKGKNWEKMRQRNRKNGDRKRI